MLLSTVALIKIQHRGLALFITVALIIVSGIYQFALPAHLSEAFEDDLFSISEIQEVYCDRDFKPVLDPCERIDNRQEPEYASHPIRVLELSTARLKPVSLEQDKIRDPPVA